MQLQVTNSPFSEEQTELLNRLLPTLTEGQKAWLSGYLAAYAPAADNGAAPVPARGQQTPREVTILFGSQTGNAQRLAEHAAKVLSGKGFKPEVHSMGDFKPNNLKKVKNLLVLISTHGEGEPPDNAIGFHEFLLGRRAPKLEGLKFSVLSLGDSSYEFFCETGRQFDARLEELGGTRLHERVDCDLDFDDPAAEWLEGVLKALGDSGEETAGLESKSAVKKVESVFSRTNPFSAEVLENINLNGRGSNKETRHLEISLEGSGLTYEPGDSLGIYPENDPDLVDALIAKLNWDPSAMVPAGKNGNLELKEALSSYYEITVLTKPLLEKVAEAAGNEQLAGLLALGNEDRLREYVNGRDLLDLVTDFGPWNLEPAVFVSLLRKMPSRLYSIASSHTAYPDEVHLTIGAVRYQSHGRDRKGVCSVLCADRLQPGDTLPVYIQHNPNFKLPEDRTKPMIMVGPGTGAAPFRSFMQEREETGAEGKAWMFFGDQHFVTDFLYQTEWQKWLKDGILTKMDVAFSRDQDEKIYVQHRMLEQSAELFRWLQDGAYFYVCGDEKQMAHDVHQTLISIIASEGGMSLEEASDYLARLQQERRYQRDVY